MAELNKKQYKPVFITNSKLHTCFLPSFSADALERALEGGSYEELCNILAKIKDLGFEKKCARLVFRAKLKTERIEKFQV